MKPLLLAALLILSAVALRAQNAAPSQQADAKWPGVKFVALKVVRYDPGHILMTIGLKAEKNAPGATHIEVPGKVMPKNADGAEIAAGKYDPQPFSLTTAYAIDARTGTRYSADATLPSKPFVGPCAVVVRLMPGDSMQLGVSLAIPVPPPPAPGEQPVEQKVDVYLPQTTGPIRGVVIPQA